MGAFFAVRGILALKAGRVLVYALASVLPLLYTYVHSFVSGYLIEDDLITASSFQCYRVLITSGRLLLSQVNTALSLFLDSLATFISSVSHLTVQSFVARRSLRVWV